MRSNKYMEQIILEELETFKRKGTLASGAVNEYLQSVENKVRQLLAYNIQTNFKELQKLLQESCQTLDRVTIGLANMVPSPNGNCSRPIEDVSRPMITSDTTQMAQWSSSDCSVKIDNERPMSTPSPDIVESNQDAMVEPSSSSASSTTSLSRPPFKTRIQNALREQPKRPSFDEFALEIPEPPKSLNVDAPEFTPCEFPISSPKSSFSQTSPDNTAGNTAHTKDVPQAHSGGQSDGLKKVESSPLPQPPGARGPVLETDSNVPKVMTSSSSMESFLTASATDSEQYKDEEQAPRKDIRSVAGFEIATGSNNGEDAGDNNRMLAPNSYPNDAESRPSSLCTKKVNYDTEQVLRDASHALRARTSNGFTDEAETRPSSTRTDIYDPYKVLRGTADALQDQEKSLNEKALREETSNEEQFEDAQPEWAAKRTAGEIPRNMKKTRVPPLWTYIHVSFSDIDPTTGKVYIQMLSDEPFIHQLSEEMNGPQAVEQRLKLMDISVGLTVVAPFEGDRYRARVISKSSADNIEVFFIDYGNKATVSLKDLSLPSSRKLTKTCALAIPCVIDDALKIPDLLIDFPETAYVCLAADLSEADRETVYRVKDIMASTHENLREIPVSAPFMVHDNPGDLPYSVVVTHADDPESMWLVESKDLAVLEEIEKILQELPEEPCTPQLVKKSYFVAYQGRRAMVVECFEDSLDLVWLDDGTPVKNVPIPKCRRLPLRALVIPRLAKPGRLANCNVVKTSDGLQETMKSLVIGKPFLMRVKNDDSDDVMLVNPTTRKYLAQELNAKHGR